MNWKKLFVFIVIILPVVFMIACCLAPFFPFIVSYVAFKEYMKDDE